MADENRQIFLAEKPKGELKKEHFEMKAGPVPQPSDGQVVTRNILLSLDAANRAWMQGPTYRKAMEPGNVMDGFGVGRVVASKADGLEEGDIVAGVTGWQDYAVLPGKAVAKLPKDYRPLSHFLSVFGIAGKTAYHGLMWIGEPKEGETVVVSAAAGSVGQYVGQIAKLQGCRVIGIAGGEEKNRFVVNELGFDACIDYKAEASLRKALGEKCPEGIAVYFDNVGGKVLEAALFNMANFGRIVCCGAVSQYETEMPESPMGIPGLVVFKRLKMQGFIVTDFMSRDAEAERDLAAWAKDGRLKIVEDIKEGLDTAPDALIGLLHGDNIGKRMVRIAPDPQ